jgi:hypothetical protein
MKPSKADPSSASSREQPAFIARGQAAAKAMAKELRAEHKRWNLPLLSWKNGKVIATKP